VDHGKAVASLWKGFSWMFAGTLVYVLSQWGMLSVLSKLGSPETVGLFSLGLAINTPIILFTGLQLRRIQATDARGDYRFGEYLRLRLFTTALALAAIVGVLFTTGYSKETEFIILAVAAASVFEALSETFYGFLQNRERMDVVARSMMLKGPLSLLFLGAGFYFTENLFWAIVAMAISRAVVLISYDARKCVPLLIREKQRSEYPAYTGYSERVRRLTRLAWLALPLGFAVGLNSLTVNVPRYLIEHYLNAHLLGVFSAIAYILISSRLLSGSLGQSASPRLARYYSQGERGAFFDLLLRLSLVSTVIGVSGIVATLVAGRWILMLLYTPEYAGYVGLLVLIMVATALDYVITLLNFALTATRRLRLQIVVQLVGLSVTGVGCVILVPYLGISGAGVALLAGKLFQLVAILIVIMQVLGSFNEATTISEGTAGN
jgi:O-antigen/teichoic acid export membrane protein